MRWPNPAGLSAWLTVVLLLVALLLSLPAAPSAVAQAPASTAVPPWVTATPRPDATPTATTIPLPIPTPAPQPVTEPGGWLADPVAAIAGQVAGWVRSATITLVTAAVRPFIEDIAARWEAIGDRFNYLTTTPAAMTYEWAAVVAARERMRVVANASLGLLALLAAYNVFRPHLGLSAEPPLTAFTRLALAALAANTTHWWTGLLIDLNNELIRLYTPSSLTGLFQSDNLLGWLTMQALATPLFLLFAVVTIVAFCTLAVQLWCRLIILNVLLVLCPLTTVLAATPQTATWAARWRDQFLAATFSQALSLIALALATQLAAPIFMAGQPGMSALAALGGLWLAAQAPRWLRDHAVPTVVGLAGTVSPLAAVVAVEVLHRRIRYLTSPTRRPHAMTTSTLPDASARRDQLAEVAILEARDRLTAGNADRRGARVAGRIAAPVDPPATERSPPTVGAPVAWDDRQGCWVTPTALSRSGAPVRLLPHLGVAVVLPQGQPYVLDPTDGSAWLADPAALPADPRGVRLGRDPAGAPVVLVAPDPTQAVWDAARGRFMAPQPAPAKATGLTYVGDTATPHSLARPTPEAVRAAGGQPATLVWDGPGRAWLAAPLDAGPVVWQPATRAFVRQHTDPLATLHPSGNAWVLPQGTRSGRVIYTPAETVTPVTVPATAYPAQPLDPQIVPMTRRRLATVQLAPVPEATGERPPAPRPPGFPGPSHRP